VTFTFWAFVALDAILLVTLVVLGIVDPGANDGGREMATIFFIILPAVIVGGAVLLFLKAESTAWRVLALVIVAGPGLLIGGARVRNAVIGYQIRQQNKGSGYFHGRDLKRAAEAVVNRDVAALAAIDRSVDVNRKGDRGMTLMQLAVEGASDSSPLSLEIVRALLVRRADPNPGLEYATRLDDPAILSALLDAGADPAFEDRKRYAVTVWLNIMPLANFTALLDHGLNVNLPVSYDTPLIVAAAENDRWNFVLLLMDRGADVSRCADRLGELVKSRLESTSDRPAEMMTDIRTVKARLSKLQTPSAAR